MTIICKQNIFMSDHLASKAINGDMLVSVSDIRRETLIFTLHNALIFSMPATGGPTLDIIHLKYQNVFYTNIADIFAQADILA